MGNGFTVVRSPMHRRWRVRAANGGYVTGKNNAVLTFPTAAAALAWCKEQAEK